MQTLARDDLTDEQVTALLRAPVLSVASGLELLNANLTVRQDISSDLLGGTVSRSLRATIHGSCDLQLSRTLAWGVDLVRPYMVLSDGSRTARFSVGVYALTTPERQIAETPETYQVSGYDRLYLLARQVGNAYSVAAGTEVLAAIRAVITAAGLSGILLDSSAAGVLVPTDRVWPMLDEDGNPTTWLRIVNDLLASINYRGVWADENGLYRGTPYIEPSARAAEFTFDADSPITIVGESRTIVEDRWRIPNRWVFLNTSLAGDPPPEPVDGAGRYEVNDTADQTARGLVWSSVVKYEAASQDALVGLGNRRVADDKRVAKTLNVTVGPFPPLGHADIYAYLDTAIGQQLQVQLVEATLDLTGEDTAMTWEAVS